MGSSTVIEVNHMYSHFMVIVSFEGFYYVVINDEVRGA